MLRYESDALKGGQDVGAEGSWSDIRRTRHCNATVCKMVVRKGKGLTGRVGLHFVVVGVEHEAGFPGGNFKI